MSAESSQPAPPLPVAVSLGDPAGVGPEIVLRLFAEGLAPRGLAHGRFLGGEAPEARPFVVGEMRALRAAAAATGLPAPLRRIEDPAEASAALAAGEIPVLEPEEGLLGEDPPFGRVEAACGAAAWAAVRRSVALIQAGRAEALVTAPLHKEALRAAGCRHPGHTEMLADLAGGGRVAMLLVGGGLRAALATIHQPLRQVPLLLNQAELVEQLLLMHRFLPWFGLDAAPRIAVAGLNPHAGEGGLFGLEEGEIVAPAVEEARRLGVDAHGPLPADTVFHFQRRGRYDAVLAMYHDQALVAVKTLDFEHGVNVTMGLPFIRTSVDHGTAFDIAGQGLAQASSLRAALETALLLAANRRRGAAA